jgi:hypothetical protein
VSALELRERDARGDAQRPCVKNSGFAEIGQLANNLDGCFLENIVGEIGASQTTDITSQRRVNFAEELFQCGPVAGLGEQDENRLAGLLGLFRICHAAHVLKRWFRAKKFGAVRENFRRNLNDYPPFSVREVNSECLCVA